MCTSTCIYVRCAPSLLSSGGFSVSRELEEVLLSSFPCALGAVEDADWLGAMLETHLSAMHTVQRMVQGGLEQRGSKLQGPELTTALTEAQGGPASVCCALAACCFAAPQLWGPQALRLARSRSLQRAASRTLPDTAPAENAAWPRRLRHVALALLAEAVSRACRRLVRATCRDQSEAQVLRQLLWSALGASTHGHRPTAAEA